MRISEKIAEAIKEIEKANNEVSKKLIESRSKLASIRSKIDELKSKAFKIKKGITSNEAHREEIINKIAEKWEVNPKVLKMIMSGTSQKEPQKGL